MCRCQKEWKRACDLAAEGGGRTVVVAALGRCSRPDELKQFLYLDFIDRDKGDHVLQKLTETISTYTKQQLYHFSFSPSPSSCRFCSG